MVDLISELKTEEGYSADIVRTYIPGDICPRCVRTTSHEGYVSRGRCCADIVRTLCGHISPGIYVPTMSALYPSSVFSSEI